MKVSGRDSLILYLHYREGQSLRSIAAICDMSHEWVRQELARILADLADTLDPDAVDTQPKIEALFSGWCDDEQRIEPRLTALRQEQLAADIEARVAQRASELEDICDVMGAECSPPHKLNKGAAWTHWERRYLAATGRTTIPESLYRGRRWSATPAHYCANDPHLCGLDCCGCQRE